VRRLREFPDPEELARMYARPHDGSCAAHQKRIQITIDLGRRWFGRQEQVTDLSCGDGAQIPRGLEADRLQLGDLAPGYEFTGPLAETITQVEPGGLFVFSETLEHLNDPSEALCAIRDRFDSLLLSTPWCNVEYDDSGNREHIWQWDPIDIAWLIDKSGWSARHFEIHDDRPHAYRWQIWACV
jgi:hypothetical protein